MLPRSAVLRLLPLALLVPAAGCGSSAEPAAGAVAASFHRAVEQGDGQAACRLLTERAAGALEDGSGEPCAQAVLDLDVSAGEAQGAQGAQDVEVWGGAAIARVGADTVFLSEFPQGWRVHAAGCQARKDQPYDCQVEG